MEEWRKWTVKVKKCNCCGKIIKTEQGIQKEDTLDIVKDWGYFSARDTERHEIVLCESCYDTWISGFRIPPKVMERTEVL
ncbi:MAG: hypothetical protein J6A77_13660 [Lachnospiraceae bacterium]|nr:hypothetical protein [Lachnospiraceae bacterium]